MQASHRQKGCQVTGEEHSHHEATQHQARPHYLRVHTRDRRILYTLPEETLTYMTISAMILLREPDEIQKDVDAIKFLCYIYLKNNTKQGCCIHIILKFAWSFW